MPVLNLVPHSLNIVDVDGWVLTIPETRVVYRDGYEYILALRCETEQVHKHLVSLNDDNHAFAVVETMIGRPYAALYTLDNRNKPYRAMEIEDALENFASVFAGVDYAVVSRIVLDAVKTSGLKLPFKLLSPGVAVRDADGWVVGASGFSI